MINFISDTVTLPTEEMFKSILNAELGDDVYGEDITVNTLESVAAQIVGMESACFMPSGTMANLSSILAHCPRGSKVLVGNESDIYIYEAGGASVCGGIVYEAIPTQADGSLSIPDLEKGFPVDKEDSQYALPALICLENSHNRCGGRVLPLNYLREVAEFAAKKDVPIHMDGARIFNASISLGIDIKEITKYVDSIQFCLSKGLSAPVGSIVAGNRLFIEKVRRIRKMLGGGMRQSGIIAAPALVALKSMVNRLEIDHANAKILAEGLSTIKGININPDLVETNIVSFDVTGLNISCFEFINDMKKNGVQFSEMGHNRIRAVVHRHITQKDINDTIKTIESLYCIPA